PADTLGGGSRADVQAGAGALVRRFTGRVSGVAAADGTYGYRDPPERGEAPEQLFGPFRSRGCGAGGRPDIYLLSHQRGSWAYQQLGRSGEDERKAEGIVHRIDGRSDHVRYPVQHGRSEERRVGKEWR